MNENNLKHNKIIENDSWEINNSDNSIINFYYPSRRSNNMIGKNSIKIVGERNNETYISRLLNDLNNLSTKSSTGYNYCFPNDYEFRPFDEIDDNNFRLLNVSPKFYIDLNNSICFDENCPSGRKILSIDDFDNLKKSLEKCNTIFDLNNGITPDGKYKIAILLGIEQGYSDINEIYNKFISENLINSAIILK